MQSVSLGSAAIGVLIGMCLAVPAVAWWPGRGAARTKPATEDRERRVNMVKRLAGYKRVIESAGIGTFFWDVKRDTLRWSSHHYAIFGWPAGTEVTHAMFRERVHPDDLAGVDKAIDTAMRRGSDYSIRFRLRFDDASIRYVRSSGRVDVDSQGRPMRINGSVVDITEAIKARSASRQRELDLAAVAVYLPDIIIRFDRELRCLFISPRIETLTGKPANFYIGKRPGEFGMASALASRWGAVVEDVLRNNHVREFDFTQADQHDIERFFITRALPSLDPEGKVETVLTISSDHTERERDTRRMREDGVLLQRADRRKNEYLATLAHELRGPLAPISSAAHLIRFSSDRAVRDQARTVIERQVRQLASLVDDLMEVQRISTGKLEIGRKPVSVQQVIEQAAEATRPLLDQKGQTLACTLPDAAIWLDGDAMRLVQVFSNLLTNASKYSPALTSVFIEAWTDKGKALVRVRDEGIGLSQASIADIFDLFVQVHPTGIQAQGGLGIGLSLVRQLVELHGGTVMVTSDGPGRGSQFTVELPCKNDQSLADETVVPPVPDVVTASDRLAVLIVDDNADGATTLALLLEALGHTAVIAFNGLDAVTLAAEKPIDMAFVDLGLPDISGVQVALRIRGMPEGRKLPLFALTGLGRDEDRYLTKAAQFDDHLVKPLQIDHLIRITREVAGRRNRTAGDGAAQASNP